MGLLSFFQRSGTAASGSTAAAGDPVQVARLRARQRLIGAAVLVIAGVIGFPLVFETQPRPIPLDIPIEIPRRDGAPPLVMPAPRPAAVAKSASGTIAAPREEVITESRAEAGKTVAPPSAPPSPTPAPTPATATESAKKTAAEARPAASAADAARAKALLEGKEAAKTVAKADEAKEPPKEAGRFVVQVGAFADAAAARETRTKVEKLGFKTYTQVVDTASGSRTRVRVGPFATRDEAEKALAKAREAGLNAAVLTL